MLGLEFLTQRKSQLVEAQQQRVYQVPSHDFYSHADIAGYFEPCVELGEHVTAKQVLGFMHDLTHIENQPQAIIANVAGTVMARRAISASQIGDCLFVLGEEQ